MAELPFKLGFANQVWTEKEEVEGGKVILYEGYNPRKGLEWKFTVCDVWESVAGDGLESERKKGLYLCFPIGQPLITGGYLNLCELNVNGIWTRQCGSCL